jgi:hypothetical protein
MKTGSLILAAFLSTAHFVGSLYADSPMIAKVQGSYSEPEGLALVSEISTIHDAQKNLYLGIVYHNIANLDTPKKEEYVQKALSFLSPYNGKNAIGTAYYGSAVTILGSVNSKKGNLIEALKNLNKGTKIIDAAVVMSPESIDVRIVRIQNAIGVSKASPVKRWTIARSDISYLLRKTRSMSPDLLANLYCSSGEVNIGEKKNAAAISDFCRAVETSPDSPGGKRARELLAKYGD